MSIFAQTSRPAAGGAATGECLYRLDEFGSRGGTRLFLLCEPIRDSPVPTCLAAAAAARALERKTKLASGTKASLIGVHFWPFGRLIKSTSRPRATSRNRQKRPQSRRREIQFTALSGCQSNHKLGKFERRMFLPSSGASSCPKRRRRRRRHG